MNSIDDANDSNDDTSISSDSSDSLHEIMGEMDAIILQMDAMHKLHDDAIERLHRVNKRIASNALHASHAIVQINNCSVDTILDNLYLKALHNIKITGKNNFSEMLLNILDGQLTDDISMDES